MPGTNRVKSAGKTRQPFSAWLVSRRGITRRQHSPIHIKRQPCNTACRAFMVDEMDATRPSTSARKSQKSLCQDITFSYKTTMPSKTTKRENKSPSRPSRSPHPGLAIDFERYIPTALSSLVAKLRANANVFFSRSYGVSLAEWRILSFLAEHGPASAYDIWTKANLDKAVVSRETGALKRKGLVKIEPVKGDVRNRSEIRLSRTGTELLDRSFNEVLRRHDNLTAGLDAKSVETLLRVVRHLESRIPHMSEESDLPFSKHAPFKRITRNT
jgi:DNA-binding MarR family transcriptional regulator